MIGPQQISRGHQIGSCSSQSSGWQHIFAKLKLIFLNFIFNGPQIPMAKSTILRTSLDVLYYSGASQVLRPIFGGLGAIFMLHHVRPGGGLQAGFAPNAGLEVTPEFLDGVISFIKQRDYDLVDMGEAVRRIKENVTGSRPFAVFTLDDAYRDNLVHARPVFRKHNCPFTIFASPAIQDGTCDLWWRGLEAVIAGNTQVNAEIHAQKLHLKTVSDGQKQAAWQQLYWPVRQLEQKQQRIWIREFCDANRVDLSAICRAEAMTWDELRGISRDPLCTIGAHTVNHYAVAQLNEADAIEELVESKQRLTEELGYAPRFFAYPYGDALSAGQRDFKLTAAAGYEAAVTTRKGLVFSGHADHLMALPRLSLSGEFQKLRYVDVLLSGSAFALWNGFKQLNVA
jgi:peptidoglycan/xylan/chitin deacetylase (PgdA/CDA1 family)